MNDKLKMQMLPQVQEQLAKDPDMAAAVEKLHAKLQQAFDAFQRGEFKSMDDAVEAITGHRPEMVSGEEAARCHDTMAHTDLPPVEESRLRALHVGGEGITINGGVSYSDEEDYCVFVKLSGIGSHRRAVYLSDWLRDLIAAHGHKVMGKISLESVDDDEPEERKQ